MSPADATARARMPLCYVLFCAVITRRYALLRAALRRATARFYGALFACYATLDFSLIWFFFSPRQFAAVVREQSLTGHIRFRRQIFRRRQPFR